MTKYDNGPYPTGKNAVDVKKIRKVKLLGRIATIMCILMYVSYIPQIIANFSGHPVSPIQPLVAMTNATLWTSYGWSKTFKDWPVIIANVPGILFRFITVITVFIH